MSNTDITRVRRFYDRGIYFLQQNQPGEASVNFRDALRIAPYYLTARTHLAFSLALEKKYLEAIRLLEEGRKSYPLRDDELIEVYTLLGDICSMRQDYPAAIFYFKAASKIDDTDTNLRAKYASALCKGGKLEEGLDLLVQNAKETSSE